MDKNQRIAVLIIGLAWPLIGLGFLYIHFGYIPRGLGLVATVMGLFAAGGLSGVVYLAFRKVFATPFRLSLINVSYLLFAPIGIMVALLAPGRIESSTGSMSLLLAVVAPFLIAFYSNTVIAAGIGLTSGVAKAAKIVSDHIHA